MHRFLLLVLTSMVLLLLVGVTSAQVGHECDHTSTKRHGCPDGSVCLSSDMWVQNRHELLQILMTPAVARSKLTQISSTSTPTFSPAMTTAILLVLVWMGYAAVLGRAPPVTQAVLLVDAAALTGKFLLLSAIAIY